MGLEMENQGISLSWWAQCGERHVRGLFMPSVLALNRPLAKESQLAFSRQFEL